MRRYYKLLPHDTYEDYLKWEGKWELIDGIPHSMISSFVPQLQYISGNLHAEFRSALKKSGCNCKLYQPIDYKLSEETVLNPDLLVVCHPITKKFLDFPPNIVVEILSPSTAMKDRHTKFQLYQEQKIPYYIIIDTVSRMIEIYALKDETYQLQSLQQNQPFSFHFSHCQFELVFANIWD